MVARRTREENRPARTVHKAAEALSEMNTAILREGGQVPFATETLFMDLKRFASKNGEQGEILCFYQPRMQELQFTPVAKAAFGQIGKLEDLDQISAWCSLE